MRRRLGWWAGGPAEGSAGGPRVLGATGVSASECAWGRPRFRPGSDKVPTGGQLQHGGAMQRRRGNLCILNENGGCACTRRLWRCDRSARTTDPTGQSTLGPRGRTGGRRAGGSESFGGPRGMIGVVRTVVGARAGGHFIESGSDEGVAAALVQLVPRANTSRTPPNPRPNGGMPIMQTTSVYLKRNTASAPLLEPSLPSRTADAPAPDTSIAVVTMRDVMLGLPSEVCAESAG